MDVVYALVSCHSEKKSEHDIHL